MTPDTPVTQSIWIRFIVGLSPFESTQHKSMQTWTGWDTSFRQLSLNENPQLMNTALMPNEIMKLALPIPAPDKIGFKEVYMPSVLAKLIFRCANSVKQMTQLEVQDWLKNKRM